jgi:amino acid permease
MKYEDKYRVGKANCYMFDDRQLFEIYESLPNASLDKMNDVIRAAVNLCTAFYICVGFFGYVAFCTQNFTGNYDSAITENCYIINIYFPRTYHKT